MIKQVPPQKTVRKKGQHMHSSLFRHKIIFTVSKDPQKKSTI